MRPASLCTANDQPRAHLREFCKAGKTTDFADKGSPPLRRRESIQFADDVSLPNKPHPKLLEYGYLKRATRYLEFHPCPSALQPINFFVRREEFYHGDTETRRIQEDKYVCQMLEFTTKKSPGK